MVPTIFMKAKTPYNIFLDDTRKPRDVTWAYLPPEKYLITKSYDAFVKAIDRKGLPKFISFDCELGEDKSGLDCAKWLMEYCKKHNCDLPSYMIHSQSPQAIKIVNHLAFFTFSKNDSK